MLQTVALAGWPLLEADEESPSPLLASDSCGDPCHWPGDLPFQSQLHLCLAFSLSVPVPPGPSRGCSLDAGPTLLQSIPVYVHCGCICTAGF